MKVDELPGLDWHVTKPLKEAGYSDSEQLKLLPLNELEVLVRGRKSLQKLAKALGRSAEFQRYIGDYEVSVMDGERLVGTVPMGELRRLVALLGTARQFGYSDVEQFRADLESGKLSWETVAAYKLERESKRVRELAGESKHERSKEAEPDRNDLSEIEQVVEAYKQDYDTRKWLGSDWEAVRMLAALTVSVRRLQKHFMGMTPEEAGSQKAANLSKQIAEGIQQISKMQDALQVSLKARLQNEETSEAHEVITKFVADAKELVRDRASILIHCGIRLGVMLTHFPKHMVDQRIRVICPECGESVVWNLVTPEMLATYTEADDFIPSGAPEGFFRR